MLFEFNGSGDGNGTGTALFNIVWAPPGLTTSTIFHPLDNSQKKMKVIIYRCQQLATNCGLCLGLDSRKFECGWCENEGICSPKNDYEEVLNVMSEEMLFEFNGSGDGNGTGTALFNIVWAPPGLTTSTIFHPLDNSRKKMKVIIYRCQQLATNCGLCLGLDSRKFECGWCENEGICSPKNDYEEGPINGGTKITIHGTNLGLSFTDVRDTVRVASAKCDVSEAEYLPSRRIVCYTRACYTIT
uniref:PSI domain-containing protein n=2 Tax=Meloidogyne enterolobii TaxID=390850 RepID=A0A6V7X8I5_MELEN|nr:unnamed protein product [Meloidogyne enterolobii]